MPPQALGRRSLFKDGHFRGVAGSLKSICLSTTLRFLRLLVFHGFLGSFLRSLLRRFLGRFLRSFFRPLLGRGYFLRFDNPLAGSLGGSVLLRYWCRLGRLGGGKRGRGSNR